MCCTHLGTSAHVPWHTPEAAKEEPKKEKTTLELLLPEGMNKPKSPEDLSKESITEETGLLVDTEIKLYRKSRRLKFGPDMFLEAYNYKPVKPLDEIEWIKEQPKQSFRFVPISGAVLQWRVRAVVYQWNPR